MSIELTFYLLTGTMKGILLVDYPKGSTQSVLVQIIVSLQRSRLW